MADKLIRISERKSVMASEIESVYLDYNDSLCISTKNGERLHCEIGYGESIYRAKDRLINEINTALSA